MSLLNGEIIRSACRLNLLQLPVRRKGNNMYSSLPNRCVAQNKRGGGKDEPFLISVVPVISVAVGKMSHS